MRLSIQMLPIAMLLLVLPGVAPMQATAQAGCDVTDVYTEALGEHADTLLGLSVQLNTGGGALTNIDTAAVNYKLLISMREFHQAQRATLPDCAQRVNDAMLGAIGAAQDTLALYFLIQLEEGASYEDDFGDAVFAFREALGLLVTAQRESDLAPDI